MDALPLDVLLAVLCRLQIPALLAVRRTCRSLSAATRQRALWAALARTHVLDADPADLDAPALEALVRRALALRRVWTSPRPAPQRHVALGSPAGPTARVIFLQFLPGRSHRWLVSVTASARPSTYRLQCWDVAADPPRSVAELTHADGPYGGVVLNSDPSSPAVLAMQSAQTETFSIRFDAQDPECAFETESTIDGIRELHLLAGSTLVTRSIDDGGALSLWHLADTPRETLQLLNPSIAHPDDRIRALHLAHDYALVVRVQSLEIYSTTPRPAILPVRGAPIAYPLAQFRFQWPTDSVVLCEQHAPSSPFPPIPRPVHLLVRFGSIYPWPVNVLHHYLLRPNPTYSTGRPRGRGTPTLPLARRSSPTARPTTPFSPYPPTSPSPSPSPSSSTSTPTSVSVCTTEYNLPYDPRPHLVHTIGSPVRLFGQAAMTLGQYGTALWLDDHTEDSLGPSERGQRLAGRMVRATEGDGDATAGSSTTDVPPAANGASMVFGVHDDDTWTRIAMDEQAGRIALGHTDGLITLMEY